MSSYAETCPMSAEQVVDRDFMAHRAKLLDIAAFLDRVDRARGGPVDDVRLRAMQRALELLHDGRGDRARRILDLFSDPTDDPIPEAHQQGAIGVNPDGDYLT